MWHRAEVLRRYRARHTDDCQIVVGQGYNGPSDHCTCGLAVLLSERVGNEQMPLCAVCRSLAASFTPNEHGCAWCRVQDQLAQAEQRVAAQDAEIVRLREALKAIAIQKPERRPDYGESRDGGNFTDCERDGWDRCAWDMAEIAETALSGGAHE